MPSMYMWSHENLTFMSSKKHFSNWFFIKCSIVYSIYVHLTFPYIFGTKLSRANEKSHIFDDQMSKCQLSRLQKRWGLHLVIEGVPYLHIQFHEIFTTSNSSRPWFSRHSAFPTTFAFFHEIFMMLTFFHNPGNFMTFWSEICDFFHDAVSRHFHRSMKFHDDFTNFSRYLPPVVLTTSAI